MTHLTDVTLRDGLQMEAATIPTAKKRVLFKKLLACGWDRLEVTSFVNPKWIPQLADHRELCRMLFDEEKADGEKLMAFVPNEKGLDGLCEFPIRWAGAFVSVTEAFNKKNVNRSVPETLDELARLREKAAAKNKKLRIYVSTAFGCPYEGAVSAERALAILTKVARLDPDEIAIGDTIGVALPDQVEALVKGLAAHYPIQRIALHLHDTYGLAWAAARKGLELGVTHFDGTTGGIGGCPYAKGASGNAALEQLAYALVRSGRRASFPKAAVEETIDFLRGLGIAVPSRLAEIRARGGAWHGV